MPNAQFPVYSQQSLRLGSLDGVRIREDTLYSDPQGLDRPNIRKNAEKIIHGLRDVLARILGPEEVVLDVASGQMFLGLPEMLTLGWYAAYVTRVIFVFTNQRLMSFRVKGRGIFSIGMEWNRGVSSANWGDIEELSAQGGLVPTLSLKYRDGRREKFRGFRRDNAGKIQKLWNALQSAGGFQSSAAQGLVPLCPACFSPLTPRVYECAKCHLEFRDEKTLLKRLFLPGGDYFYAKLPFLGVAHAIAGAIMLIAVAIFALGALGIIDLSEPDAPSTAADALTGLGFLAFLLVLHKGLTFLTCRKLVRQFIPAK